MISFSLTQFVDGAFVLLVATTAVKCLLHTRDRDERGSRWSVELRELEQALRGLITEAGDASSKLDRSLLQRKTDLENLLKKLNQEELKAKKRLAGSSNAQGKAPVNSLNSELDLPNESWLSCTKPQDSLSDLIEATTDRVSLSNNPKARTLAAKLAQLNDAEEMLTEEEEATYKQLNILDKSAYRIARRLLSSGTEIHVVARKLEMTVGEVRMLERLMRQESQTSEQNALNTIKPEEKIPSTKIIRSEAKPAAEQKLSVQRSLNSSAKGSGETGSRGSYDRNLESQIERQVTVL